MDDAQQETPVATIQAPSGTTWQAIMRLLGGLAVLSVIGAAVTAFMLRDPSADSGGSTTYPPDLVNGVLAYDVNDAAPTSYGSFRETRVHLTNADDSSEVDVSLTVNNNQLLPMKAPALGELRMINEHGAEATYLSGGWGDNQIVLPHTSASADFRFAAPPAGGMLILEYQAHAEETPIRVAVGYVLERPDAAQADTSAQQ